MKKLNSFKEKTKTLKALKDIINKKLKTKFDDD